MKKMFHKNVYSSHYHLLEIQFTKFARDYILGAKLFFTNITFNFADRVGSLNKIAATLPLP